jgi:hypothetical protein
MQQIDWHDFVVVETITFDDEEDGALPPPMSLRDVIALNRSKDYVEEGPGEAGQEEQAAAGGVAAAAVGCWCWRCGAGGAGAAFVGLLVGKAGWKA